MAVAFRLPDIGEGVAEAEVVRWLVVEGDEVEENQPVIEVQTDKAVVELPAPASGRMGELCYREGEVVPVGEVLYRITPMEDEDSKESLSVQPPERPRRKRVLAAPSTRRLARELGVDLSIVEGTGGHGRITDEDVRQLTTKQNQAAQPEMSHATSVLSLTVSPLPDEVVEQPLSATRRAIAERLLFSVTHKPHATHFDELEADGLVEWRKRRLLEEKANADAPHLTYMAILAKLVAVTLRHYPVFNAHFDEEAGTVRRFSSVSLGIATNTPRGLVVPVLRDADRKSMNRIAAELTELTRLAREGKLKTEQLKGSTFTISNAGALGGKWATPIINPPEVAILAIHPLEQKPVVKDGELRVGWRMNVSLSFDHRVLDGADAIRFTQTLGKYTADPGCLLREMV